MLRMIRSTLIRGFALLWLLGAVSARATVIVRNGGDVVDSFLEQTRESLVQVVVGRSSDATRPTLESRCRSLSSLLPDEQSFCEEFVRAASSQIFKLNRRAKPTEFKLVLKQLEVESPDGSLRPVAAVTDCGAEGPILFHYDSVRSYSPKQLFFLMVHEFGHKISFQGEPCVTDNDPIGPFGGPGGGRRLIDAVATVLTQAAVEGQLVGDDYAIFDNFSCLTTDERTGISGNSSPRVERVVFDKGLFDWYQTGVGHLPRDSYCSIQSRQWQWQYTLRMEINEPAGCRLSEKSAERSTLLRVMKEYYVGPDGTPPPAEEVTAVRYANVNPICDEKPRQFVLPFSNEYGDFSFTINYISTQTVGNRKNAAGLVRRSGGFWLTSPNVGKTR